jgi:excisionase family DNA binding protein
MDMDDRTPKSMYTLQEAAQELRLSPDTVRTWIKAGLLPATRVGRPPGRYRVRREDLLSRMVRRAQGDGL